MSKLIRNILLFFLTLAVLGVAVATIGTALIRTVRQSEIGPGNPNASISPPERLYIQLFLYQNRNALSQPASSSGRATSFTVYPGETATMVADRLASSGLLDDTTLFVRYLQYNGLDNDIEAGDFTIDENVSLSGLAIALTDASPKEVTLTFLEGWRVEEMARYLDGVQPAEIDAERFLAIAMRKEPFDFAPYPFLANLPEFGTLEGYLFPDTYRLPLDATADDLITAMLNNFDQRLSPDLRQAFGTNDLTLREAVTLASIIEREAVHDFEKPMIASVFFNRIANGMAFEADPTVQYAVGYYEDRDSWWKVPLTASDLKFNSYYNTYLYAGFPPGPIAAPGMAALEAVANPMLSDNLFFVVDCTADQQNTHTFSVTYEEHLAKVLNCRG